MVRYRDDFTQTRSDTVCRTISAEPLGCMMHPALVNDRAQSSAQYYYTQIRFNATFDRDRDEVAFNLLGPLRGLSLSVSAATSHIFHSLSVYTIQSIARALELAKQEEANQSRDLERAYAVRRGCANHRTPNGLTSPIAGARLCRLSHFPNRKLCPQALS